MVSYATFQRNPPETGDGWLIVQSNAAAGGAGRMLKIVFPPNFDALFDRPSYVGFRLTSQARMTLMPYQTEPHGRLFYTLHRPDGGRLPFIQIKDSMLGLGLVEKSVREAVPFDLDGSARPAFHIPRAILAAPPGSAPLKPPPKGAQSRGVVSPVQRDRSSNVLPAPESAEIADPENASDFGELSRALGVVNAAIKRGAARPRLDKGGRIRLKISAEI